MIVVTTWIKTGALLSVVQTWLLLVTLTTPVYVVVYILEQIVWVSCCKLLSYIVTLFTICCNVNALIKFLLFDIFYPTEAVHQSKK